MNLHATPRMTVDEYLAWSVRQPEGRFELQDGRVIVQQSQNVGHIRTKQRAFRALETAIASSGLPLYALPDGATVRINAHTAYEPDALVAPLPMPEDDSLEVANPLIVVEVLSPGTRSRDVRQKSKGYAKVASIAHYLIVDPGKALLHHSRATLDAGLPPAAVTTERLELEPPGFLLTVAEIVG